MKNWKLRVWCSLFSFFHVICKISNFNMWTAKHLVQAFCTELTLKIEFFGLDTYLFYDSTHYAPINGGLLTYKYPFPYPPNPPTQSHHGLQDKHAALLLCIHTMCFASWSLCSILALLSFLLFWHNFQALFLTY